MRTKSLLLAGSIAGFALAAIGQASADSATTSQSAQIRAQQAQIDYMKRQIELMQESLNKMQATTQETEKVATETATAVAKVTPPKGKRGIQVGNITITPGGFIEAAGIYRSKNMTSDIDTNFNNTPFKNSSNAYIDENRFTARQSRLSLLMTGDVDTDTHAAAYYEMDFLGAANTANSKQSNSYNPRIRHVYGTVDWDDTGWHLLAGQTWSLMTLDGKGITPRSEITPLSIDAHYVVGFNWTRNPQFRVTKDLFDKKLWLAASVENAQETTSAITAPAGSFLVSNTGGGLFDSTTAYTVDQAPDVLVKAAWEPGWGHYEVYGVLSSFRDRTNGSNKTATGGGAGAAAYLPIIPKLLDFQVSGLAGQGIGRYGTSQLPDLTYNNVGNIHALSGYSVLVGLIGHPTPAWDIYAYGGMEHVDNYYQNIGGKLYGYGDPLSNNTGCQIEGGTCTGATKDISEGTVGFWWKFYQGGFGSVRWGAQYEYITRTAYPGVGGGGSADNNIVMTSLRWYPF